MPENTEFTGRTAVVTGAAGDLGQAVVRLLASRGATVLAVDIDGAKLKELSSGEGLEDVHPHVADVSDSGAVAGYVEAARDLGSGAIHAFFNNAGIEGPVAGITDYPEDAFDRVCAVNLKGVFLGLRHVAPHMGEGGSIVNTASTGGLVGFLGGGAYVATKHGVVGLTRVAALDLAERGIRVNAVCPGPVAGRMTRSLEDQIGVPGALLHNVPLARLATPGDVAGLVAFLLGDASAYITGVALPVDGGQTAA
jgi:NAD(P)-dependent dehydrogenase (short-subunit alcohol dehydrogenase family)